jgi:hypothetical protein
MKKTTIHSIKNTSPSSLHFDLVVALLVVSVITGCAIATFAQDAAKANDKPVPAKVDAKAPPAEVTLPAVTVKALQDGAKDARIAQLEYENLAREIKLAESRLKDLLEAAKKAQEASNDAFRAAAIKAGVPPNEIDQYEGAAQPDGSLLLKRKAVPAKP